MAKIINSRPLVFALAGNPNSGKTTLFNELTGSHYEVGNWAGVTVERKEGICKYVYHNHTCTYLVLNVSSGSFDVFSLIFLINYHY